MREQAGHGADWIKLYTDFGIGADGSTQPTFTAAELKAMVEAAHLSGRPVAAHAMSDAGMRMAIDAGVDTIEHGYQGSEATFRRMRERGIAWLPTLTAAEAYGVYFEEVRPGHLAADAGHARCRRGVRPRAQGRHARSPAAATWACSTTATTRANPNGWCAWA